MTDRKKMMSMRISAGTRAKLDALAARYGTQTTAIEVALSLLYEREIVNDLSVWYRRESKPEEVTQ